MTFEQWIDTNINITLVHTIACFFGAGLCVYITQMNGHVDRILGYSKFAAGLTRVSLVLMGLSLMWATYPGIERTEPWLSDDLVILALDFCLFMRAVTIALRWKPVIYGKNPGAINRYFLRRPSGS